MDHLIKLACVFSPYKPHISVYMCNKPAYLAVVANYIDDHPLGCNLISILVLASLILRTTLIPVNLAAI